MSENEKTANEFRPLLKGDSEILIKNPRLDLDKAFDAWVAQQENGSGDLGPYGWGWVGSALRAQANMRKRLERGEIKKGKDGEPFPPGSLKILGKLLNKDERTIRRYCERGLLPLGCAVRLKSGQWRINYNRFTKANYTQMARRLKRLGLLRERKTVAGYRVKIGKASRAVAEKVWVGLSGKSVAHDDGRKFPEAAGADKRRPLEKEWYNAGENREHVLLIAIAQCRSLGQFTMADLAKRLGVSRPTLYRRFSKELNSRNVKAALRAKYQEVKSLEGDLPSRQRRTTNYDFDGLNA